MRAVYLPTTLLLLSSCLEASSSDNFLSDASSGGNEIQNVLTHQPAKDVDCRQPLTGPIETTLCDFETLESVNDDLYTQLKDLVRTPFFKYFRLDLYRECPFWQENAFCMNRECGITTVDESEIPEKWRAAALSKVELPSEEQRNALPGCYYRDTDFCFLDDESEGDYVDLSLNPERFTGYVGPSAHRVWSSIYEENCFGIGEEERVGGTVPGSLSNGGSGGGGGGEEEECLEKKVYYKIISGLHASISTHICGEYFNQSTGQWGPNLPCFISRIATHPDRLRNIYFNTVLLLRAVARLQPYLTAYDYCPGTGTHEGDSEMEENVAGVVDLAASVGRFDEGVLFRGENANVLKEEFKAHFRNVTRIMDCVGCDKCRLWGKVQTTGVATALKVLFELDEKALDPRANSNLLQRSEVVALFQTLWRFSESLHMVDEFRRIWAQMDGEEERRMVEEMEGERVASSWPRPAHGGSPIPPPHLSVIEQFRWRLGWWLQACKEGTAECVNVVLEVGRWAAEVLSSLFRLSGKEGMPRAEL